MGLAQGFVVFPFIVMATLTLFAAGTILGGGSGFCVSNPNSNVTNCTVNTNGTATISCASTSAAPCDVSVYFVIGGPGQGFCGNGFLTFSAAPPSPFYCGSYGAYLANGHVLLPVGQSGTISAADLKASSANLGLISFVIQDIGTGGFVVALIGIMGLVVLASLQVVNSGMNTQGTRVLMIAGSLFALWFVLSAMEGYGSAGDFFASMNTDFGYIGLGGMGTVMYVVLTLFVSVGTIGWLSGGGAGD